MEILIVGLIIVALMVYTSTRIKRNAAAAYEAETVETDDYIIEKPAGFLHNLNGDPAYLFEAYSKEFSEEQPKLRRGTAKLQTLKGTTADAVATQLSDGGTVRTDLTEVIDEYRYRILGVTKDSDGIVIETTYKLADARNVVYKFAVASVDGGVDTAWVETFIDSFRVK